MIIVEVIKDIAGIIGSITGIIGFVPQIYKAYKTKATRDVSIAMLFNYLACCISWGVYGAIDESFFVLWSNVLGSFVSIITISQKIYYDNFYINKQEYTKKISKKEYKHSK
jgi:MtN3 and saliva related transmembrane protein